ncbi:MAG: UDP-N-acetylmuramoyl-L-alanyl-D-glutamate--2,6-diaminopimelate ligase [Lentisphaeria bacterium]|nr:UDP-N-acetylmuramoyl-L-alanyl-D-glutamate--2,6-diaminopimelate ligase [Lentisphaeria bacterium]
MKENLSLAALLETLSPVLVSCENLSAFPRQLKGIASHSGKVEKDFLFCAVEGAAFDGHMFISGALEKGAKIIVHTREIKLPADVVSIKVKDSHLAWALCSSFYYGNPGKKLNIYAITGTNGKTSTAFMVKRLLELSKAEKTGLISTVEYDCGSTSTILEGVRTTPDAMLLQEFFAKMTANACKNCVMEASSHGLHQHRMGNILFAGAIFTNLTGDHLDYHGTMENYYQAKKLLFTEHIAPEAPCVINVDDLWGKRLAEELKKDGTRNIFKGKLITVSTADKAADAFIRVKKLTAAGSFFTIAFENRIYELAPRLIGLHNIYNVAQSFLLALVGGADGEKSIEILKGENIAPPGRLEGFYLPSGAGVFVDYAHTDDALSRVLEALLPLKEKRLFALFGCGGDRDKTKRPRMALAASLLADSVMVTSDNPRTEEPLSIIEDIVKGFPENYDYMVEPDRRKAIKNILSLAEKGDIVLIAGKGHENYQESNGVKVPFDDREEVRRFIKKYE